MFVALSFFCSFVVDPRTYCVSLALLCVPGPVVCLWVGSMVLLCFRCTVVCLSRAVMCLWHCFLFNVSMALLSVLDTVKNLGENYF